MHSIFNQLKFGYIEKVLQAIFLPFIRVGSLPGYILHRPGIGVVFIAF